MPTSSRFRRFVIVGTPLFIFACATGVPGPPPPPGYELLRCRPAGAAVTQAEVDETGGTLAVRNHRFVLPPRAVGRNTRFTVRERRTGHVGVDITPRGTRFDTPARLTLSYAHCDGLPAGFHPSVVEVEHGGTAIVGPPIYGEVDSAARTVTVDVEHLSGYLIGTNRSPEG
jgi:hypothetical protein